MQVTVIALGTTVTVTVDSGATIADAFREARVNDSSLVCRYNGANYNNADFAGAVVQPGSTLVFSAPALKHGA